MGTWNVGSGPCVFKVEGGALVWGGLHLYVPSFGIEADYVIEVLINGLGVPEFQDLLLGILFADTIVNEVYQLSFGHLSVKHSHV